MHDPSILVLAAGMGSRYGGLKQLEPMGPNGETLLDYSIYDAIQTGFKRIVFIIRRDIEEPFRNTVGSRYADKIDIAYAFQSLDDVPSGYAYSHRTKPWGTAHALYAARQSVSGSFAVINADDFYGRDAYRILAQYFTQCGTAGTNPISMVGYQLDNTLSRHGTVNRGLCKSMDGMLQSVEEITNISMHQDSTVSGTNSKGYQIQMEASSPVSMNFWGFSDNIFTVLEQHFIEFLDSHGTSPSEEFYIPSFIDDLITREKVQCRVLKTSANWFGMTYPADRPIVQDQLQELIDKGLYPSPLMA